MLGFYIIVWQELVGNIPISEIDIEILSPQAIVTEIFDSTLREIVDEVNIPLETLSDPLLIGIARNTTSAGRPSSEYVVRLVGPRSRICVTCVRHYKHVLRVHYFLCPCAMCTGVPWRQRR